MTYREVITKVVAQLESAIQTGDPDTIQIALLPFMALEDIDDGSADDLLKTAFAMISNLDDSLKVLMTLQ